MKVKVRQTAVFLRIFGLFLLCTNSPAVAALDKADHTLTYTEGNLTWDKDTYVYPDGSARLNIFDSVYDNVQGENGEKVIAPGTEMTGTVRLENTTDHEIKYTAVLYFENNQPNLPVNPQLKGENLTSTYNYSLPRGITRPVVSAVSGEIAAGGRQDFEILWSWAYSVNRQRDNLDTMLGDKAANFDADYVNAGLYVVVEDGDSQITVSVPDTGDDRAAGLWLTLAVSSGAALCLAVSAVKHQQ